MTGDDRQRFCAHCERSVYNLSSMTKREADRLLQSTDGQVCTRLFRRADGTVLTEDCPLGWNALKRRVSRVAGAALSAALTWHGAAFAQSPLPTQNGQQATDSSKDETGRVVSGTVTDPTGAVVPNTRVKLIEVTQGAEFRGVTGEDGAFRFSAVPAGVYRLTIEMTGFQTFAKDTLILSGNRLVEVNAVLMVGTMGGAAYEAPTKRSRIPQLLHFGKSK